jgi:hypothetical protein
MLAMWPSAYGADTVLDRMTYAGAPGTYTFNLGAGAGISYKKNGFSLSGLYISNQLSSANSGTNGSVEATTTSSGIGSASSTTFQAGYAASNWGMAFAYTYTNFAQNFALVDSNASYAVYGGNGLAFSAYWQPKQTGIIPSISAGVGSFYYNGSAPVNSYTTWEVALQWNDAFIKGNALGMSYGDTVSGGSGIPGAAGSTVSGLPSYAYELFYKFQVTDNISVTPAFFWINGQGVTEDTTGGLIKSTFMF